MLFPRERKTKLKVSYRNEAFELCNTNDEYVTFSRCVRVCIEAVSGLREEY